MSEYDDLDDDDVFAEGEYIEYLNCRIWVATVMPVDEWVHVCGVYQPA